MNSYSRWIIRLTRKLENAFANRDRIAGKDCEVATVPTGETLRTYPNDFVSARTGMAANADSRRGGDACVAAGHGDRFQQVDSFGAAIGHFITAGTIDLAEHGEATLGVANEHDVDPGINEVIASVEIGKPRGRLSECESGEMNRAKQRNTQIAFAIQTSIGAQIIFAKNFDRDLVVCAEDITARGAYPGRKCGRCRRWRGRAAAHARNWVGWPDRFS